MSTTSTYAVSGMTCGHCVRSVTKEVHELPGIEQLDVVLQTGALTITSVAPLEEAAVRAAVEDAGYQLA